MATLFLGYGVLNFFVEAGDGQTIPGFYPFPGFQSDINVVPFAQMAAGILTADNGPQVGNGLGGDEAATSNPVLNILA